MAAMLSGLGLTREEAEAGAQRSASLLKKALADPRGRWILERHEEGGAELSLSGVTGGTLIRRKIDRTFIDRDGVRWIIDYKTGAHEGGDLSRFLSEERMRYSSTAK